MTSLPEDDDLLAAELALGLIEGAERRNAEARLVSDSVFAEAHARWQARAAAMFTDGGEEPRPAVWSAIEAQLQADDWNVTTRSRPKLHFWQSAGVVASLAAIVLAVIAVQKPAQVLVKVPAVHAPSAPIVAVLTGKTGIVMVSFNPDTGRLTSAPNGLRLGDHVPELWVIPANGKPRSLGVMNARAPGWKTVPPQAAAALAAGATIAISMEPLGGSRTGQPTGPVILTGKMVAT